MAGEPNITIVGNLTEDPELKFTPSGAAVANFRVASNSRTYDRQAGEWKEGETSYFRCAAWRQLAEHVAESLQKGQRVLVNGRLTIRDFERQDGSRGTSAEINVDEIGPSLRFATAQVSKVTRSSDGSGQQGGQPGGQQGGQQGGQDPWAAQPAGSAGGDVWGGGSGEEPPF